MMTHTTSSEPKTPDVKSDRAVRPEIPGADRGDIKQNKVRRTGAPGEKPNILGGIGGWLWLAVIILPIYYIFITSFRTSEDLRSSNQLLPTTNPTLAPFIKVLQNDFLQYFTNSLIVTLSTVAVVLSVSVMAAYYITRSTSLGGKRMFQIFLLGIAIPVQATIIPVYYLIQQLGIYDTLWALILPQIAFAIPLSVLIIVNFVRDIPTELFESMKVDGAGEWRILTSLVLPMAKPALMTVGIYQALQVWNSFLFPLVLTQSSDVRVLPLSLWEYSGQFGIDVPATLAAVVLSALPLLVAYIFARRHIVAGLTAGFGK